MAEFDQSQLNKLDAKKQIERHGKFKIVITIILAIVLLLLLWGAIYSSADVNSYRIVVSGKRDGVLSLSFDPEFSDSGFSVLKGLGVQNAEHNEGTGYTEGIADYIDKVASGEIPMEIQPNNQEGKAAASGTDEYIASKFYLKNVADLGSDPIKYRMRINILENSKNALSAVRFLVISDTEGEKNKTMYAQPASDGTQEKAATKFRGSSTYVSDPKDETKDWLCTSLQLSENNNWFYDTNETDSIVFELNPQEVVGYCVCVWYEGSDPEHTNDILGGYITFNVTFAEVE